MPEVLYEDVIEVEERVILHQKDCQLNLMGDTVLGKTGEQVCSTCSLMFSAYHLHNIMRVFFYLQLHILTELNKEQLIRDLKPVISKGIKSLAVVLLHSYT